MELADGLVLAAFADPANAITWSLELVDAMPEQVGRVWEWVFELSVNSLELVDAMPEQVGKVREWTFE